MQKRSVIKTAILFIIFFAVYGLSYYGINLLQTDFILLEEPLSEQLKYGLSISLALLTVLVTNRLSRQLYQYFKNLIIKLSISDFIIGIISVIIGLIMGALASVPLAGLPEPWSWVTSLLVVLVSTIAAIWAFNLKKATILEWSGTIFPAKERQASEFKASKNSINQLENQFINPMILDTSAIIDGRIGEIARSGFLFGVLIVPSFILHELQQVADSSNAEKRQRGRSGLKLIQKLKRNKNIEIQTLDDDYPEIELVDSKLVQLAKDINAKIITCDYNLNKVAKIRDIAILNVNELANQLKQQFLPGEPLVLRVSQSGKEDSQGIGYLDDGTMVVIQGASKYIGEEVKTTVERVLQT